MARKQPLDPNASKALIEMKEEISRELGVTNNITNDKNHTLVNEKVQIGGRVGGNMTKKLVEMGEKDLIEKE